MATVTSEDTNITQQMTDEQIASLLEKCVNGCASERDKYFAELMSLYDDPQMRLPLMRFVSKCATAVMQLLISRLQDRFVGFLDPANRALGKLDKIPDNETNLKLMPLEELEESSSVLNLAFGEVSRILEFRQASAQVLSRLYSQPSSKSTLEVLNEFLASVSSLYHKTGVLLIDVMNRWYDGLDLLEKSLAIRRQLNDLNARADTIYQIAHTHHLMGNLDTARTHYRDALRLYEHTGNQHGVAACKSGLGHLMTQNGFIDEAIGDLKSARRIYRTLGDKPGVRTVNEILQLAQRIKEKQPA